MIGLALGLAFLLSFGLGFASVVAWIGLAFLLWARQRLSPIAAVSVVAVALVGAYWGEIGHSSHVTTLAPGRFEGVARVVEVPSLIQDGQRLVVQGRSTEEQRVCVYTASLPRSYLGDLVFLDGVLTLPYDLSEVGRAAAAARNCTAQLSADNLVIVETGTGPLAALSRFRGDLSEFLMQAAPGDTGALLSGLVTGEDGGLSAGASQAFLTSGTSHITAISGSNFAMLTLLLGVMATGIMRRSIWFVVGATGAIWFYALMVGLQPSAFRAALLATAVLTARWLGRLPDLLTLTLLLASAQIVLRPQDFDTLAFQLSLAATLALIVVFDGIERFTRHSRVTALALSVVAAQLATLPVLATRLGTVSGIGLFANLIVGPLAAITFPITLFGGLIGLVIPWVGEVLLLPAVWMADAIVKIVTWTSELLPSTVQLGEPVAGAIAIVSLACWLTILMMSPDLRRAGQHVWEEIRRW